MSDLAQSGNYFNDEPPEARQNQELPFGAIGAGLQRRDRHGRGMRGPMLPPTVPVWRSRADYFDDCVLAAVAHLEHEWAQALDGTEFAVEEVPPSDPAPWEVGGAPLGRYFPPDGPLPARVTIYRRPIVDRAGSSRELVGLVRSVVVEQVAHLLGRRPEEVDPGYGEGIS